MTTTTSHEHPDEERATMDAERSEVLGTLAKHRAFLAQTLDGVSDADAARTTTVSELTLGGLVKHVTQTEANWVRFVEQGPSSFPAFDDPSAFQDRLDNFRMLPGDTVASVLAAYAEGARRTEAVVAALPSLDVAHPLPEAPWFEPGSWSARRVLLHVLAETAQHAGHADIVREALDGAKTMG